MRIIIRFIIFLFVAVLVSVFATGTIILLRIILDEHSGRIVEWAVLGILIVAGGLVFARGKK